jgi:hypothetical protein
MTVKDLKKTLDQCNEEDEIIWYTLDNSVLTSRNLETILNNTDGFCEITIHVDDPNNY